MIKERKKISPCKCVHEGLPADLTELVETVTRTLWIHPEGEEDWDEWRGVHDALMCHTKYAPGSIDHEKAVDTITDFVRRRANP
jgi:hypothetical protein